MTSTERLTEHLEKRGWFCNAVRVNGRSSRIVLSIKKKNYIIYHLLENTECLFRKKYLQTTSYYGRRKHPDSGDILKRLDVLTGKTKNRKRSCNFRNKEDEKEYYRLIRDVHRFYTSNSIDYIKGLV